MKRNVAQEDSDILEYNGMRILTRYFLFVISVLLASCGAVRRSAVSGGEITLSVADQRKYEYYFLEA